MEAFLLTLNTPDSEAMHVGVVVAASFEAALPKLQELAQKSCDVQIIATGYTLRPFQPSRISRPEYVGCFPILYEELPDNEEMFEEAYHIERITVHTV